jgi:glyoxylase-like metal-dependent hydrolase (beta-lactamase superfamily II)
MKMTDRRGFLQTGLGALAALAAAPHWAAARTAALPTQKLTDRVTVIGGAPGNVIALSTDKGVLLVDSGSVALAPSVRGVLAAAPVHTLFNTHHHPDQTGGNVLFGGAGAEIHAHVITRQWLATDYYVPADYRWVKALGPKGVPTVTFRGRGEIKAGAETVEFGYLLEAHTRGDIYVFFRDANVLAVGDVASPERDPVLDWYAGGWIGGRADAMDELVKLANDQTKIVPAYGPVMTRAQLQAEADMMKHLFDVTTTATDHGRSAQDMLDEGVLNNLGRKFQDPYRFLYDVAKGNWAHYTNFGGNIV